MWDQLPFDNAHYDINERNLLDENLRKFLNELRQKLFAVAIYVSINEKDLFDEIYSHMMDIEKYVLSALKKKRDPSSKPYEEYTQKKKQLLIRPLN